MKYYLGIDLGGTNIAVGIVNEECEIVGRGKVKTRPFRPAEEIADDMAHAARLALADAKVDIDAIEWIGIGTPGTANRENGVVEYANNLGFRNVPLADLIQERLGKKTYIANDADAAAYGEYIAGSAKGVANALAITLGTGVGGGIIIDHKIYSGFNFAGGELGHMGIVYDGRPCTCGRKGCIEAYASATGLVNMTREAMEAHPESKMWEIAKTLDNVDGRTAFDAMRAEDAVGKEVVDTYISYLSYGLASFVNIFQPEVLCIGGGICKEGETLLAPIRAYLEKETYGIDPKRRTRVVAAALGNDAGIIGAAFLGKMGK